MDGYQVLDIINEELNERIAHLLYRCEQADNRKHNAIDRSNNAQLQALSEFRYWLKSEFEYAMDRHSEDMEDEDEEGHGF